MNFTIEKDVPKPKTSSGRSTKYPFADLKPGDSFFVPGKTPGTLSSSVTSYRKKNPGVVLSSRTVTEDGVKGVRVWRDK